jgi:adenylate kinase
MRLVFLGAPGVGKGTQAQRLAAAEKLTQISTGDILRDAVKRGTALGVKAKSFMDAGKLVPDDVVIALVEEKLKSPDVANGYILDGFPRTVAQAESLDRLLTGNGITHVINFEVPKAEIIRRLSGRRNCAKCLKVYHVESAPPRRADTCDGCGEPLQQRADDKPETIESRLGVYDRQTSPLIEYYKKQGLLHSIDATASIEDVYQDIQKVIQQPRLA